MSYRSMKQMTKNSLTNLIAGISKQGALERFKYFAQEKLRATIEKNKSALIQVRFPIDTKTFATFSIYQTEKVLAQCSPTISPEKFGDSSRKVLAIATESAKYFRTTSNPPILRAGQIVNFIHGLNLDDEITRMSAVILSDTTDEIAVQEKMKAVGFSDLDAYSHDSIIKKLDKLEARIGIYERPQIESLRNLRNGIAHAGHIPSKMETERAIKTAKDTFEFL